MEDVLQKEVLLQLTHFHSFGKLKKNLGRTFLKNVSILSHGTFTVTVKKIQFVKFMKKIVEKKIIGMHLINGIRKL